MPDIVSMFHGRPTGGMQRWVNARLSLEEARKFHRKLSEALAEIDAGRLEEADIDFPAVYVHANAAVCTGTVGTESVEASQMRQSLASQGSRK